MEAKSDVRWIIRPMEEQDIEACLQIWRKVNLTEGKTTVLAYLTTDPEGFYVAESKEDGSVLGMCAIVMNRQDTAFVGFYGVEPKFQGIGIGRALWAKTFARLEGSLNVGLYGVPEMAHKYKRAGFLVEDSIRMFVYESEPNVKLNLKSLRDFDKELKESQQLVVLGSNCDESLFDKLVAYDSLVTEYSRENLLRKYFKEQALQGILTLVMLDQNQQISGYGCVRGDNYSAAMIGPIYARSSLICEALLKELILRFPIADDKAYSIMSLSSNDSAVEIIERIGFKKIDTCSRLFKQFVPKAKFDEIYCVLSPNFSLF